MHVFLQLVMNAMTVIHISLITEVYYKDLHLKNRIKSILIEVTIAIFLSALVMHTA